MGNRDKAARLLGAAAMVVALAAAAPATAQRQVLTVIESERMTDAAKDKQVGSTAGALLGTTYGGADVRALTDFGVNKINAQGSATHETYATSAWLDTFTVSGATGSMVTVSFNFAVDGLASFDNATGAGFNFNVFALRGGDWAMSGYNDSPTSWFSPMGGGAEYERLILTQTVAGRVSQADMRDFDGFYNYANTAGQPGAFGSHVTYVEFGDYFRVRSPSSGENGETRYYATGFRNFVNGNPTTALIPYAANAQTMAQGQIRANLVNNYSLLDFAGLCAGECEAGDYPGDDLSLSFTLAAGSTFTLASWLYADDVSVGTVNFFNTAKVSGVSVSNGGTLTSASGALQALPGGGYGYPAAVESAVPEPATWALMIGGFGMIGGAMRRRTAVAFV